MLQINHRPVQVIEIAIVSSIIITEASVTIHVATEWNLAGAWTFSTRGKWPPASMNLLISVRRCLLLYHPKLQTSLHKQWSVNDGPTQCTTKVIHVYALDNIKFCENVFLHIHCMYMSCESASAHYNLECCYGLDTRTPGVQLSGLNTTYIDNPTYKQHTKANLFDAVLCTNALRNT